MDDYTFTLNGKTYTKDSVVADADKKAIANLGEYGGEENVLFVPSTGKVSWTTKDITAAAKYNFVLKCYPIENKSAAVERVFI